MKAMLIVLLLIAGNGVAAATILGLGHGWQAIAPNSASAWPWAMIAFIGSLAAIFFLKLAMAITYRLQSSVRMGDKESMVADPSVWQEISTALGVIAAALSGALTIFMRKLKTDSVPRSEFNGTVESLRREISDSRTELVSRIEHGMDGINQRLDQLMLAIVKDKQ